MTMNTTTTNPSIDALDLRPALEMRMESQQLIEAFGRGECTQDLVQRAEELLAQESALTDSFVDSLTAFGAENDEDDLRSGDAAWTVVNTLATGQLGAWVDWMKGRPTMV